MQCLDCMHDQPHLGVPQRPHRAGRGPLGADGRRHAVGRLLHRHGRRRRGRDLLRAPRPRDALAYAAFGDHGTREFFTHVRFHKHDDDQIVVHLLVELYARSAEEATEVLEEAARGQLTITSLAEESRPPAATAEGHQPLATSPSGAVTGYPGTLGVIRGRSRAAATASATRCDGRPRAPPTRQSPSCAAGRGGDAVGGGAHPPAQLAADRGGVPGVPLQVLHPLEVADGHAAAVDEDVGDDPDPALGEDRLALGRRRAVRRLDDAAGTSTPLGVLLGDLALAARRGSARRTGTSRISSRARPRRRAPQPSRNRCSSTHARRRPPMSRPSRVDEPAGDVADADDRARRAAAARGRRCRRRCRSPAPRSRCPPMRRSIALEHALGHLDDAEPGGDAAHGGAAEHLRLAGDDLRHRVAVLHRVGVHEPRHLALAGAHVGRRDVAVLADAPGSARWRSGG